MITKEDLKTAIYAYQVDAITNGDDTLVEQAIQTAITEMKSYLANRFEVNGIFANDNPNKNHLLVSFCKDIAVWHLAKLAHVDMLNSKERYEYAVRWLTKVSKGEIVADLPYNEQPQQTHWIADSNPKFNHYY